MLKEASGGALVSTGSWGGLLGVSWGDLDLGRILGGIGILGGSLGDLDLGGILQRSFWIFGVCGGPVAICC